MEFLIKFIASIILTSASNLCSRFETWGGTVSNLSRHGKPSPDCWYTFVSIVILIKVLSIVFPILHFCEVSLFDNILGKPRSMRIRVCYGWRHRVSSMVVVAVVECERTGIGIRQKDVERASTGGWRVVGKVPYEFPTVRAPLLFLAMILSQSGCVPRPTSPI